MRLRDQGSNCRSRTKHRYSTALLIIAAAAHRRGLSAPFFFADGDLGATGSISDHYHRAASGVDSILRGGDLADLLVQAPTKHETILNLKTAKALGLDVPPTLLARANWVGLLQCGNLKDYGSPWAILLMSWSLARKNPNR